MVKNKRDKFFNIILFVLAIYLIFFIYSNINLSKKKGMVFYEDFNFGKNSSIVYKDHIISGAEPIFINRSDEKIVLLLHGLGGTPIELKELAFYLADKNFSVVVPLLLNQGKDYRSLKNLDSNKLYKQVEEIYLELNKSYKNVFVGGLCNGGSLSLKLAESYNITGLILMSTPIIYGAGFLKDSTYYFFHFIKYLTPNLRRIEYGLAKNRTISKILPSFDRLPVKVLLEGEKLRRDTKNNLNKVYSPTIIIHSNFDNRASPVSANYIFDNIKSENKKIIFLNNSGHVITMDYDKDTVFEEVYKFLIYNAK